LKFSINDALNDFGKATAVGNLPNNIYVGRPANSVSDEKFDPQGGEIKIPYFAEFQAVGNAPTAEATLSVEGAPDNHSPTPPATGWAQVGSLVVPAGTWKKNSRFNVAFSDSPYKWFRAKTAGTGTANIQAFLKRA
jgi:hypothetical protein